MSQLNEAEVGTYVNPYFTREEIGTETKRIKVTGSALSPGKCTSSHSLAIVSSSAHETGSGRYLNGEKKAQTGDTT